MMITTEILLLWWERAVAMQNSPSCLWMASLSTCLTTLQGTLEGPALSPSNPSQMWMVSGPSILNCGKCPEGVISGHSLMSRRYVY